MVKLEDKFMRISLYYLITIGIILASLAFYFQKTYPLIASILALTAAFLFIKGANALRSHKKSLKMQQQSNNRKKKK